jgi:predicted esterase
MKLLRLTIAFSLLLTLWPAWDAHAGKILDSPQDNYCIFVPSAAEDAKKVPLLIALPGKGIEPASDIQLWQPEAEIQNFFVIDFKVDYAAIKEDQDIRDLHKRISRDLTKLAKTYHFDDHDIYIAGTSAGAVVSLALSLRFPNTYNTVGLVSGGVIHYPSQDYLINARNIQFLIVHGQNDSAIILDKIHATKSDLEKNGADVSVKVIANGEHSLSPTVYKEVVDWFKGVYESPLKRFARLVRNNLTLNTEK